MKLSRECGGSTRFCEDRRTGSTPVRDTMGKPRARYCVRANPPNGWQIWDRKRNKWWGKPTKEFPSVVLDKLNTGKQAELKY